MILFLLFMKILNVISWRAFIVLEIFEVLCILYRGWGKNEN